MFICVYCDLELREEEYICSNCGYQFEAITKKDAEYLSETKLINIINKYPELFSKLEQSEIDILINIPKKHNILVNYKEELILLNFLILYTQLYLDKMIINDISLYSYRNKSFAIKMLRKIKLVSLDNNINNIIKAKSYLFLYNDLSENEKNNFIKIEDILLEHNIIVKDKNKLSYIIYCCIKDKEIQLNKENKIERATNEKIINLIKCINLKLIQS